MSKLTTSREERGQAIAQERGQVVRIDDRTYRVKSQTHHGWYKVCRVGEEWVCECADNVYRHLICKHIFAVDFSKQLRLQVQDSRVIQEVNVSNCKFCGSSNIRKDGVRKNKAGVIQIFECKDCHKYMTFNLGFEHMKHNPQAITTAMQLYFSGESLRNTQKSLKLLGVQVSHKTIFMWIKKYISLMQKYVETLKPNVSDTWRADELFVKISGNQKYLFAMMDDETRFWIAQQVADKKYVANIRPMFKQARKVADKNPATIISDGASNFAMAINDEFSDPRTRPTHYRDIAFDGHIHNNKMERMNGELRDREKVMRSLKKEDSPILKGMQIFHNFIRPHMGLKGSTPAEMAGIQVKGENKWKTLIENAKESEKA